MAYELGAADANEPAGLGRHAPLPITLSIAYPIRLNWNDSFGTVPGGCAERHFLSVAPAPEPCGYLGLFALRSAARIAAAGSPRW